ncbi:hypothetical protein [Streptomyces sp. NPDC054854]
MDAIDLLKRYLDQPIAKEGAFFDEAEKISLTGVVREEWRKAVVDERSRVERIPIGSPTPTGGPCPHCSGPT